MLHFATRASVAGAAGNPATREKLLAKLFDTHDIQGLQQFIHAQYVDNQSNDKKAEEEITAQLNMCEVSSEQELTDALERETKTKIDNEALFKNSTSVPLRMSNTSN